MNPSPAAPTVLPLQAAHDGPTCPTSDAAAPGRPFPPLVTRTPAQDDGSLATWVRRRCPHLKADGRCRRERGACRLLGPAPRRCGWAEGGPVLGADESVYRAYLAIAGGPWWRRVRVKLGNPPLAPTARKAMVRHCPDCGEPVPPRRRVCDRCGAAHRQETWRGSQAKHRENGATMSTVMPEGITSPADPATCSRGT